MAENKHTPGPWRREGSGDGLRIYAAGQHGSLFGNEAYYPWCSDNEADWDLIAAAPELLEIVKSFIAQEVDYMTRNNLGDPEKQHNVIWGRAAIAKAEGREP